MSTADGGGARAWGVEPGYEDASQTWRDSSPDAIAAVLELLGAEDGAEPPESPLVVAGPGRATRVPGSWEIELEAGGAQHGADVLPADLPLGYHVLRTAGGERRLVVAPEHCFVPDGLRTWGWAVQLYAARSRASWGIGDLADLHTLAAWSAARGSRALMVNPLHAAVPGVPQQASPYFPSSRCFRNPLYLRVEDVPGADAEGVREVVERAARAGRALDDDRRIDRDEVYRLKLAALETVWRAAPARDAVERHRVEGGSLLRDHATFCALAETNAVPWPQWEGAVRHPRAPGIAAFAERARDRIEFHEWLQWCVDRQLGAAGAAVPLVNDVAIGVDPAGSDAWQWQDVFVLDARVGAPPDEFNGLGQDWGLPPFDPWKLRAAAYEPFIATVRAAFRHAGGLRLDHVMGLFRLYWIPPGADAKDGVYVRYPADDLLAILALESTRAEAFVVGEDLGTVEDAARESLAARRVLSYRVLWFEEERPEAYPELALAAATTHDLPTIAGLWSGRDLETQRQLGLEPNVESTLEIRDRLAAWTGVAGDAGTDEVVAQTYALLAGAASAVVMATLDDAVGVEERPNHPGTVDEWPNWSLALPTPLEDVLDDPRTEAVATALAQDRT